MEILPLDQLRFNIILLVLITAYTASGIGNFFAFIPGWSDEDAEMLGCNNNSNYSFRLISSLLFFLLGISLFRYAALIYISIFEICLTIIIYGKLIIKKWRLFNKRTKFQKNTKKMKSDDLIGKFY